MGLLDFTQRGVALLLLHESASNPSTNSIHLMAWTNV